MTYQLANLHRTYQPDRKVVNQILRMTSEPTRHDRKKILSAKTAKRNNAKTTDRVKNKRNLTSEASRDYTKCLGLQLSSVKHH